MNTKLRQRHSFYRLQQWLPHSRVKPESRPCNSLHHITERQLRLCDRDEFP